MLARARRSVLVVDAGEPRNAPAAHTHGFLTRDGASPGELLELGRAEVRGYGAEVRPGQAVSAAVLPEGGFAVRLADGDTVRARRLLVTTGLVDELPDVPGVRERWGRDAIHCPYCHGWEVRDQAVAVLGGSALTVHQALLFRQWTDKLTLFLHTAPEPTDEQRDQLSARGINVLAGEVAGLVVTDDRLTGVRLASGEVIATQAVVVGPRFAASDGVLASLGVDAVEHPMGVGTQVPADSTGLTAVPGVWVAGNVADPAAGIAGASAAGSWSAAMINADLVAEDTARAVAERAASAVDEGHHHGNATGFPGPDLVLDEAFCEEMYRSRSTVRSGLPNLQLVTEAADLAPGTALDVGSGEGADAVWLAERGWQVTAVDISATALLMGESTAAQAGPGVSGRITWRHADMTKKSAPDDATYDLVTAHFMQLSSAQREDVHRRLAAAVSPGGTLLIVGHHPSDVDAVLLRDDPSMLPPAALTYTSHVPLDRWSSGALGCSCEGPDWHRAARAGGRYVVRRPLWPASTPRALCAGAFVIFRVSRSDFRPTQQTPQKRGSPCRTRTRSARSRRSPPASTARRRWSSPTTAA
ncbi:MAG: methyltransferase domain-containing protein [Geodermatophilaceae bacterium]